MHFHRYRPTAFLRVSGADAASFLQGQFTNELRRPVGAVVYGLWLDQKGKVLADSHVLRLGENEFQIASTTSAATVIQARLEEYIVADEVVVTDETAPAHGLAVSGPQCGEILRQILGSAPPRPGHFLQFTEMLIFAGRRTRGENYELIGSERSITGIARQLPMLGGREIAAAEMEFIRIQEGIPSIPNDLGPGDLPHEGGLEDAALSYTKGCYLGQEVMARLKNLGQVRRRLHVIRGPGVPPAVSAPLYQDETRVGQVRSVAVRGDGFVALALLSLVNLAPAAGLSLAPEAAPTIRIMPHG
ncbi:MAG: folate-binding protein [Opitutae bacterium]|nr:folate-binding protein [Opitutae bacterium]